MPRYANEYDPEKDPFAGSAHCETVANRLADLFDCECSYNPSDDGHLVTFRLVGPDGGISTILAIPDRASKQWNLQ